MFILSSCSETVQMCYNARKILVIIKTLIKVMQWSVPLLLVFLGSWDMFKAVTKADDQKVTQDALKSFIRRLISGLIVFLVPFLVRLVLSLFSSKIPDDGEITSTSWVDCWIHVGETDTESKKFFQECSDIYKKDKSDDESENAGTTSNGTSDKQTNSNGEVTKNSKTCYVFDLYSRCSVGTLTKTGDKYYSGASCRLKINGTYDMNSNASNEKCINDCLSKLSNYEIAAVTSKNVCSCISEAPRKSNVGLSSIPSFTADGTYKIYTCNSDVSCSNAANFCIDTGKTGKTKSE